MAGDDAFEAVLGELGLDWETTVPPPRRKPASASSAAREMRSAGFVNVRAREVELLVRSDRRTYLDLLEQDDASLTSARQTPSRARRSAGERASDGVP
jgi:hypothetical protein